MVDPNPGAVDACAGYVGKWQAREPEMAIAEVFCPPAERRRFRAWGALLHELREAAFELSDPRVTAVKTGWWAEQLLGGLRQSQHPLALELAGAEADWPVLGRALLATREPAERAGDTESALAELMPLAAAVATVETGLFASADQAPAARSLAVHWLLMRLPQGLAEDDQARLPMHLLARHGLTPAQVAAGQGGALLRDWAKELATALPEPRAAAPLRRFRARFDRARLARLAAGAGFDALPPWATLWHAWRAARGR